MRLNIQKHKSLSEVVYEELRQQILAGTISPGTRMMEIELSEKMGVSRTPVREAIKKLEKEGLVVIEPRHGAYTSQVSISEMIGILEVRQHMDTLAARFAAERGTAEEKARIVEYAKAYADATVEMDPNILIKNDERFHEAIAEASHNSTLLLMVTQLQDMVIRFRYIYYNDRDVMKRMVEEHQQIVDAIMSGDGKHAEEVASGHIEGLIEMVKNTDIR